MTQGPRVGESLWHVAVLPVLPELPEKSGLIAPLDIRRPTFYRNVHRSFLQNSADKEAMVTTEREPTVKEVHKMLVAALEIIALAAAGVELLMGEKSTVPYMNAKLAARVAKVGEVAYRHLVFIREHGSMTMADSLVIRQEMYGAEVKTTANFFGLKGSGALFYRDVPEGTPLDYAQSVKMTNEGTRIAELWEATHVAV